MKLFALVAAAVAAIGFTPSEAAFCAGKGSGAALPLIYPANNCVSFSVGPGTGCAWMCTYCANELGTDSYYFTDEVCTYEGGGCVGNPQTGVIYTCCSA